VSGTPSGAWLFKWQIELTEPEDIIEALARAGFISRVVCYYQSCECPYPCHLCYLPSYFGSLQAESCEKHPSILQSPWPRKMSHHVTMAIFLSQQTSRAIDLYCQEKSHAHNQMGHSISILIVFLTIGCIARYTWLQHLGESYPSRPRRTIVRHFQDPRASWLIHRRREVARQRETARN